MNEFAIIERYFKQRTPKHRDVLLGIGDDCALLSVPAGHTLAVSIDTLISGVHFPVNTLASDIGYKSLAVSLSDLAAMGAEAAWVMLALTMPVADEAWLQGLCQGFFELIDQYGLELVGGDLTRGSLSLTTQVMGFIPTGQALLRSGAKVGDKIFVTGSLGAAGLGLLAAQNRVNLSGTDLEISLKRLNRPEPRLAVGKVLRGVASAAIDISDGLLADLGHILEASGVGASIDLKNLPVDWVLKKNVPLQKAYQLALSAGDDYELCFTASEEQCCQLKKVFTKVDCSYHCIGVVEAEQGVRIFNEDQTIFNIEAKGYQHFD